MIDNTEFVAMSDEKNAAVIGGGLLDWAIKLVVEECVSHFTEFKQGFRDGYNAAM